MIVLDPKKIMRFIVDVTNARDTEYLADVTKVPITAYKMNDDKLVLHSLVGCILVSNAIICNTSYVCNIAMAN